MPPNLRVERTKTTTDAIFGKITWAGEFVCYSMERKAVAIPTGTFAGRKRWSNANRATVVGIDVPGRTDIEIHSADWAKQLKGCVATGDSIESEEAFADTNNKAAFNRLMALLPDTFTVIVS